MIKRNLSVGAEKIFFSFGTILADNHGFSFEHREFN